MLARISLPYYYEFMGRIRRLMVTGLLVEHSAAMVDFENAFYVAISARRSDDIIAILGPPLLTSDHQRPTVPGEPFRHQALKYVCTLAADALAADALGCIDLTYATTTRPERPVALHVLFLCFVCVVYVVTHLDTLPIALGHVSCYCHMG